MTEAGILNYDSGEHSAYKEFTIFDSSLIQRVFLKENNICMYVLVNKIFIWL